MRGVAARSLYNTCVRLLVIYGIEVWHHKILKMEIHKLEAIRNMALRRIPEAFHTIPITELQKLAEKSCHIISELISWQRERQFGYFAILVRLNRYACT